MPAVRMVSWAIEMGSERSTSSTSIRESPRSLMAKASEEYHSAIRGGSDHFSFEATY